MERELDELRPEDLMVRKSKEPVTETAVGGKYVPVKLSSVGKLGFPAVIHVRDYSYSDALTLASASTTVEIIDAIVKVLSNVIQESDIDLYMLTSSDVLEILMTIQGTWYSPSLELPYYVNPDLTGDELEDRENISKATILINSLNFTPFPSDKKAPFTVTMKDGFTSEIDIPRFYNEVIVHRYIENRYAELDNTMEELNKKIKSGSNTLEEYKKYMDYREARVADTIKASQAMQIVSINGKKLNTLAERIEAMKDFPLRAWSKANRYITEDLSFGIDSEVTFPCTVTGKMITRRFPFRIMDFIPTVESIDNAGDDVSVC